MKVEVGNDFECNENFNANIGGYKVIMNDNELKVFGFTEVDILKEPHGGVTLRAFEHSIFELDDKAKEFPIYQNFNIKENTAYYTVTINTKFWIFKDLRQAIMLFEMIFASMNNGVLNRLKSTDIIIKTVQE